jgi:hypothetical protein
MSDQTPERGDVSGELSTPCPDCGQVNTFREVAHIMR